MASERVVRVEIIGDEDGEDGYIWLVEPPHRLDVVDYVADPAALLPVTPTGVGPLEESMARCLDGFATEVSNPIWIEAFHEIAAAIREVLRAREESKSDER